MTRWLLLATLAAGGSVAAAAAPEPASLQSPGLRWEKLEPLSGAAARAATAAGAEMVEATVWADPGVDCWLAWAAVGAGDADPVTLQAGFVDALREAGAEVGDLDAGGRYPIVLGRYRGAARLTAGTRAEMTACLCSERYPEEAKAACERALR